MKSRLPEMLSEEFDKKIRDAAAGHHPSYDEKAWVGMKQLLDKHMPEEKEDRRRGFFFLLFFLLLGGGIWYFVDQSSPKKEKETAIAAQPIGVKDQPSTVDAGNTTEADNRTTSPVQKGDADIAADDDKEDHNIAGSTKKDTRVSVQPSTKPVAVVAPATSKTNDQPVRTKPAKEAAPVNNDDKKVNNKPVVPVATEPLKDTDPGKTDNNKKVVTTDPVAVQKAKEPEAAVAVSKKDELKAPDKKAEEKKPAETSSTKKTKQANPKRNFFFLSVSGGPDVSFTGNDKVGKMKLLGGAGLGYTIKDKFTLRTGFYSARKIYTSSPEEYHAPDAFYTHYPNMQKIEADCKVYEIPLSISYNFMRNEKRNLFASAGLSTYLMKRETYDYYYKYYPTAPTVNKEYTARNENNHYFSVLTVSAGYQRNIGKRVSVMAEPYFKVPLKGVGFGNVKLNSTGVLFTLSVKPFKQAEKK